MNFLCVGFFKAEPFSKSRMAEQVWEVSEELIQFKECRLFTSDFSQWEHESDSTVENEKEILGIAAMSLEGTQMVNGTLRFGM